MWADWVIYDYDTRTAPHRLDLNFDTATAVLSNGNHIGWKASGQFYTNPHYHKAATETI